MSDIKMAPFSEESEMSILSSILKDSDMIHEAMSKVDPDDFLSRRCRILYTTMLKLERKSKPIDMIAVCDQLKNNALLETVGGIEWVSILEDYVPTSTAISHHCNKVRSLALQRKVIGEMTGYLDQAHKITDDPSPLLEEVYGSVFSIMNQIDNIE